MVPVSATFRDGSPDGAAFGEFLRQARERRGLTIQQISHETKIPWRHLDALEHGQLNAVPGGTYRRGEIRAYAEVVGLDKALALERLDRALQASSATTAAPAPAAQPWWNRQELRALFTLLVIGAAGVIAMRTLWTPSEGHTPVRPGPIASQPIVLPSAVPASLPEVIAEPPLVASVETVESAPAISSVTSTGVAPMEATPDTARPAVPAAGLTVTSDPPGARVTVDGIARGTTPVTIAHLEPGDRRVRLTMPTFSAVERVAHLPADRQATTLHVDFNKPRP